MSMGCTGKLFKRKLRTAAVFKLNGEESPSLPGRGSEHFLSRAAAGKCNLRDKLLGKRDIRDQGNGWWLTAIPRRLRGGNRQPAEVRVSCMIVNGHPWAMSRRTRPY